ncbi:MAG: pseudouridine synthase [Nitrospiraceae bacterium]|nr:pseudouridine synthase [Nitrospiraceae bacterium]
MLERVQKIISAAGVTSRRAAEQLITEGRVRVNGKVVTELGTKADASKDHIKVDGKLINPKQPLVYIMLNKPAGFVTTMADPEGRPTVLNLLKGLKVRVYPVGRLDYNTEGLLLLTNDGDFAHLITHPKHEFPKTYRAKVKGMLTDEQINLLEQGIYLDDGKTAPAKLKKISKEEANSWLEITIHEGRKRQVRRMFDRVGHSVIKLKRVKTGNLVLGDLPEGSFRYLSGTEVKELKEDALKTEVRTPKPAAVRSKEGQGAEVKGPRAGAGLSPRGDRRPMTDHRPEKTSEQRRPGPGSETKGSWRKPGPRVPGQGASGRGPRRAPREEVSKRPNQGPVFSRPGTGRSFESREKSQGSTVTRRPGQGIWDKGAEKSLALKPRRSKTTAARMFGKTFSESTESGPRTRKAAGTSAGRKPQRAYNRQGAGKPKAPGSGRKPYRSRS